MITIIRSDGAGLVLDGARTLMDIKAGLLVDFGDEVYIVEGCTLQHIAKITEGHWNSMFVLYNGWKGWPDEEIKETKPNLDIVKPTASEVKQMLDELRDEMNKEFDKVRASATLHIQNYHSGGGYGQTF